MTATANTATPPPSPRPLPLQTQRGLVDRLLRDPNAIWMREMRQSARLGRTPWLLFAITLTISLLMCSIGGIAAASQASPAIIGEVLFQVFFSLAFLVVVVVGPAVAANSIASEREGRTWEAVLLTGLTPKTIARGKFLAAYTTLGLYIVVLAPVGALSFLFGGVTATEVVIAFLYLFAIAGLTVAFGLAVSSLMSSMRMAIVLTLILAILGGVFVYILTIMLSGAAHSLWSEVPEWYPVWLPIAYSRATFGLDYVLYLIALPALVIFVPAWFLYEVTVANLTSDAEDRSTGLRRWFAVVTPLVAAAAALPCWTTKTFPSDVAVLCMIGCFLVSSHVWMSAMLFAFEPPGPSRRVRVHWQRERTGAIRRFFGPGLAKAAALLMALGFFGILSVAAAGVLVLQSHAKGSGSNDVVVAQEKILCFAAYLAPFSLFIVGLVAWLRSRGNSPWISRVIAAAIVFLVSAVPWVITAIGGVLEARSGGEGYLLIGAPSPFFVKYMVDATGAMHGPNDVPVVEVGTACALLWGVMGLVLWSLASSRCAKVVAQYDRAVAQADAALRAEDEAAPS